MVFRFKYHIINMMSRKTIKSQNYIQTTKNKLAYYKTTTLCYLSYKTTGNKENAVALPLIG